MSQSPLFVDGNSIITTVYSFTFSVSKNHQRTIETTTGTLLYFQNAFTELPSVKSIHRSVMSLLQNLYLGYQGTCHVPSSDTAT